MDILAPLPLDAEETWAGLGLDDRLLRAISKMVCDPFVLF